MATHKVGQAFAIAKTNDQTTNKFGGGIKGRSRGRGRKRWLRHVVCDGGVYCKNISRRYLIAAHDCKVLITV